MKLPDWGADGADVYVQAIVGATQGDATTRMLIRMRHEIYLARTREWWNEWYGGLASIVALRQAHGSTHAAYHSRGRLRILARYILPRIRIYVHDNFLVFFIYTYTYNSKIRFRFKFINTVDKIK